MFQDINKEEEVNGLIGGFFDEESAKFIRFLISINSVIFSINIQRALKVIFYSIRLSMNCFTTLVNTRNTTEWRKQNKSKRNKPYTNMM